MGFPPQFRGPVFGFPAIIRNQELLAVIAQNFQMIRLQKTPPVEVLNSFENIQRLTGADDISRPLAQPGAGGLQKVTLDGPEPGLLAVGKKGKGMVGLTTGYKAGTRHDTLSCDWKVDKRQKL